MKKTHVLLGSIALADPLDVWDKMQWDYWRKWRYHEALLEKLGINRNASMLLGDAVVIGRTIHYFMKGRVEEVKMVSPSTKKANQANRLKISKAMIETLETIPENSIIHSDNYVSSWNGYLAIVFSGMGFNAENLASGYMIEYITGDDNDPIKVDDTNQWMIGKLIRRMSGDAKAIENYPRGMLYIRTPETMRVWVKKSVKELNSDETAKYVNRLSEIGYIDNTDWQISKTAWSDLFKNGFDELEKKDSNSANKIYELLRFKFGRDFDVAHGIDSTVKTIKGVYTLSKADLKDRIYQLKWIVENKKTKAK